MSIATGSYITLTNCTFNRNEAAQYGGALCNGFNTSISSNVILKNCILWDNLAALSGDEIYNGTCILSISHTNLRGGVIGIDGPGQVFDLGGNIDADPLFMDPDNGDYHLQQIPCQRMPVGGNNPCVDTGDPMDVKIRGTTRTDGVPDKDIIDMGFHYPPYVWTGLWLEALPDLGNEVQVQEME